MDIQKVAVGVCAVGTACVVGGTAVVDQVTNGSEKRKMLLLKQSLRNSNLSSKTD